MWKFIGCLVVLGGCAVEVDQTEQEASTTTVVSLTFDDTLADQYQVGALVAARGMHATFYVNSPRIGRAGYLSRAQVDALAAAGNDIGGHTLDHLHLTALDATTARHEICDDRAALLAMGYPAISLAYPFGDDNTAVQQIAASCGYSAARDVGGLVNPGSCSGCPYANTIPPQNAFSLRTNDSIKTSTTLATMQSYVTQAEQHGGGWVPIVMHHVCDGCNTDSVSATTLGAFLDWLRARGTTVRTVAEVMGQPAPPPVTSLIQNGSLELDANGDQVPDCWQRGGYGTNTATFTLTSDASDGRVAQRIDMTSFTSGARRIVTRQDSGTCAPAAAAGRRYTVSARYHATVPVRFTIYARNASGTWAYVDESPAFAAATAYTSASYTTIALPSGSTAISIGLSIYAVGSVTMDQFALVDAP